MLSPQWLIFEKARLEKLEIESPGLLSATQSCFILNSSQLEVLDFALISADTALKKISVAYVVRLVSWSM
jgi:hypothetical protein